MEYSYASDSGRMRPCNEDSVLVLKAGAVYSSARKERCLFILADGVGGSVGGGIASSLAVKTLADIMSPLLCSPGETNWKTALDSAFCDVNKKVYDHSVSSGMRGMGSTLLCCLLEGPNLHAASVGDSRLYLIDKGAGEIRQVTRDHTVVRELLDSGEITAGEALRHPGKGIMTRAVGCFPRVKADTYSLYLGGYDIALMCSDGLSDVVSGEAIVETVLGSGDLESACRNLVEKANGAGGPDNVSVMLFSI
ncbi:MAG: serine/threonine-protein phosphatase [Candidatus Altiarchaeota archaeon]|nr:serine/threonine-protein phosphatase [Candidatus Altiarchaeota archaeon]